MDKIIDKKSFSELIKGFKFPELFNELGWDSIKKKEKIKIDDAFYELDAVGQKRDFVIFSCLPVDSAPFPDKNMRRKIDNDISKRYFEHLIIYSDQTKTKQIWQLVIREPNKPIIPREFEYYISQYPELLLQKLSVLFFSIDDEDNISLPDVKAKIHQQFNANAEKVTKKFYDEFKKHHTAFLKLISGIDEQVNKEWYASLMLNRLMFIYFIQKKDFLITTRITCTINLMRFKKRKERINSILFTGTFYLCCFIMALAHPKETMN